MYNCKKWILERLITRSPVFFLLSFLFLFFLDDKASGMLLVACRTSQLLSTITENVTFT